ncbi:panthothenate synthetase, partial [bacterium]|nr:panthothenate synthetase [bacterium]
MRMLLRCNIPHEPFNTLVREGRAGQIIGRIVEDMRPEAVYFTEEGGKRCG